MSGFGARPAREILRRLGWGERGMGALQWDAEGPEPGIVAAAWEPGSIEAAGPGGLRLRWRVEGERAEPEILEDGGKGIGEEEGLRRFADLLGQAPREPIFRARRVAKPG